MDTLSAYLADHGWSLEKISRLANSMRDNNFTEAEALYYCGEFTENNMLRIYSELYGVTVLKLKDVGFNSGATTSFGAQKCIDNRILFCTYQQQDYIVVGDPSSQKVKGLLQEAGFSLDYLAVASKVEITKYLDTWVSPMLLTEMSDDLEFADSNEIETIDLEKSSDNAILNLINRLVNLAYQANASDIQIIPSKVAADVFFRIDGKRIQRLSLSTQSVPPLHRVLGSLAGQQTDDEHRLLQGKLEFKVGDKPLEVRLNIIPTKLGSSINLRLHSQQSRTVLSLTSSDYVQKIFDTIQNLSDGLVLFCGPTGSGKSTTMSAIARQLLNKQLNICSVEDPVELVCPGINQVDIAPAKGLDYVSVSKAFLRHDPDVMIIGEIRDVEVANIAIQAADTGHLILSTLHARDAVSAISRLISLGVDRTILADNLTIVVSQRLVRRICPFCYKSHTLTKDDIHRKAFNITCEDEFEYHSAVGCSQCNNTGYIGRTIICECLIVTSELHDAIERGASSLELAEILKTQRHYTLLDDGIEKVRQGHTTFEELEPFLMTSRLKRGELLT